MTEGTPAALAAVTLEGIDSERVSAWITEHVVGATAPYQFALIAGGRSNLTYRVTDGAGRVLALRRPPLSHVLPTAHDMAREYRVITALGPTDVPVPHTYGVCEDPAVNTSSFYVMEFVNGHIVRDPQSAEEQLAMPARAQAGMSLADTLARLHAVDVDAVGLGDFAKRDGYIERQLRRWYEQFRNSQVDGIDTSGIVSTVAQRLSSDVPAQQGTAIVHGDYRLDNTVLGDDGTVRAVLDWEICTLGDPLADLGLLMVYWTEPGDEAALIGVSPTAAPGFSSRTEVRARYQDASDRDLSRLDFYVAFGYWKLACILQGVYARYAGGATAGDRSSVDGFAHSVVRLAERALETLEAS